MTVDQLIGLIVSTFAILTSFTTILAFFYSRQKIQFEAGKKDARIDQMERDIKYLFDQFNLIKQIEKSIIELTFQVKNLIEKMDDLAKSLKDHEDEHKNTTAGG